MSLTSSEVPSPFPLRARKMAPDSASAYEKKQDN